MFTYFQPSGALWYYLISYTRHSAPYSICLSYHCQAIFYGPHRGVFVCLVWRHNILSIFFHILVFFMAGGEGHRKLKSTVHSSDKGHFNANYQPLIFRYWTVTFALGAGLLYICDRYVVLIKANVWSRRIHASSQTEFPWLFSFK